MDWLLLVIFAVSMVIAFFLLVAWGIVRYKYMKASEQDYLIAKNNYERYKSSLK